MLLNYNGASPEYHCQDIVRGVDLFYNISNLNMIIDHDFILLNQNSHQRKTLQWKIVESEGFGGLECFYPAFSHTSYFKIYHNQKENERKKTFLQQTRKPWKQKQGQEKILTNLNQSPSINLMSNVQRKYENA